MPNGADLLELELSSAVLRSGGGGRRLDFSSVLDYFEDSVDDLLELMPGQTRSDRLSVAAVELAGTGNKKSKSYKSARRQLERWSPSPSQRAKGVKPRRPKPPSRRRIKSARARQDEQLRAFRLHGGAMRVQVVVYKGKRPEWVPRSQTNPVRIRQRQMRSVIRAWTEGDPELAFDILWTEFVYGLGNPNVGFWEEVPEQGDLVKIELYPRG